MTSTGAPEYYQSVCIEQGKKKKISVAIIFLPCSRNFLFTQFLNMQGRFYISDSVLVRKVKYLF